jgi:hypothetical protein
MRGDFGYMDKPIIQATTQEIIKGMETLLMERMFWTAGRKEFDRQGWSHRVEEETAIRDVNYRDFKLYKTSHEAVRAALSEEIESMRATSQAPAATAPQSR